jgi:uncharacterized protein (TIGR00730 family)
MKTVAVYGSARPAVDSAVYQDGVAVGRALATAGYCVMTGGYDGIMAAVSQGAAECGGHVIGVTVRALELIGERVVNRWVKEEIKYETMTERLVHLTRHADAYIVMPGGVGTLQELSEVWQIMRMGEHGIPVRPLIAYGTFWQPLLDIMVNAGFVGASEMQMLHTAHTPDAVVQYLHTWNGTNGKG